jgi:hypothetical protein
MSYSNAVFFIDPEGGSDTARTALTTVTASNPSGSITRMTKAAHGLTTGAVVTASSFTAWLNVQWKITVVDADNFDLDDAVWQTTGDASGTITPLGGSSFADAWKTMAGITGVVGYGSTIRIKESDAYVNPGNATWTDGSTTITWAAAHNKVITNCDSAWTASANVTATAPLDANTKEGSACVKLAPATAFTTGKLAYFTLPSTLDLSAFQQVSLWFSGLTGTGNFSLKLCSDSAGDTPVNTLVFPAVINHHQTVVLDNGAALGSGINSIALYAVTDPGTTVVYLDNIVACKAPGASDCITHAHVISKNTVGEPEMYAILSIQDDSVEIGGGYATTVLSTGYQNRPYTGTTETVATYVMTGFKLQTVGLDTIAKRTYAGASGAVDAFITISGGWNRTDMTTQTGASYLNGSHYNDSALGFTSKNYIAIEKVGFFYLTSTICNWSGIGFSGQFEQIVGCYYAALYSIASTGNGPYFVEFSYMHGANLPASWGDDYYGDSPNGIIRGTRVHGFALNRSAAIASLQIKSRNAVYLDRLDNVGGHGLTDEATVQYGPAKLIGCAFSDCYRDEVGKIANIYHIYLYDCTFQAPSFTFADRGLARIFSSRHGGADDDHRIYAHYFTALTDATTRHTASGVAWKLSPTEATSFITAVSPAVLPLAKIAVTAGTLVTVKCWLRRDNTGISAGIRLLPNNIAGTYLSDTQTLMTAAADTWEEVTLTFTPTVKGVVEIVGIAWGGTTYNAWFDDLTITQA